MQSDGITRGPLARLSKYSMERISRTVLESRQKLQALKDVLRKEQEAMDLVWLEFVQFLDSADQQGFLRWMLTLESMCFTYNVEEEVEKDECFEFLSDNDENNAWSQTLNEWLLEERNTATGGEIIIPSVNGRVDTLDWTLNDLILLIKAVNIFPRRLKQRWESVAQFVNQNTCSSNQRLVTEVKSKAKSMRLMKKRTGKKRSKLLPNCVRHKKSRDYYGDVYGGRAGFDCSRKKSNKQQSK
ncbi:dnaJ homolog subfamily C member 2-like [Cloeon dipterum]|uniref:dnaJ homolog subfamily C member 2-like n=1 Tax=Cloeon dipterum TaxID=197152 RepID=UPI0032201460